jgi:hypothetical protein
MVKVRSVLEYDAIPFNQVDLGTPVTQLVEMNDGYMILVAGELRQRIHASNSHYERGGIQVNEFASLRDFFVEEWGANIQDGELVFEDDTLEAVLQRMTQDGDPVVGGGMIQLKKLAGTYRDPETLFMSFFEGEDNEDEDEDEEVMREEDCA